MGWQKISSRISTATLLGWAALAATPADANTDKSIIAASAKAEES